MEYDVRQQIARMVAKAPERPALVFCGTLGAAKAQRWSYGSVWSTANRLSCVIQRFCEREQAARDHSADDSPPRESMRINLTACSLSVAQGVASI